MSASTRRRLVATALVVVSLVLVTVSFRQSSGGGVHGLQATGAEILRPFQVAAERIARPFQDAADWFGGLTSARADAEQYRKERDYWRQLAMQNKQAVEDNQYLKELLRYRQSAAFPSDYRPIAAQVIGRPPTQFDQQVTVAAGSNAGIRRHDPVVADAALVGQVTKVTKTTAQVTLLPDASSAVSAVDFRTGAEGMVVHGEGEALVLDGVRKDQVVHQGDVIVTSGWRSGRLSSIYPKGIPIGRVTYVGQVDTEIYKQVQVQPFVRFSNLQAVLVLTRRKPQRIVP